jgi:hypothetical protein
MSVPQFSDRQYGDGARLLKELLPQAKAMMPTFSAEPVSDLARATMPHLREDNLLAVMIYEAEAGGWIADVVCKHVPPGISNVLGTPVGDPLNTREEALENAVRVLACVLVMGGKATGQTEPVFNYHDVMITLDSRLLAFMDSHNAGYSSVDKAYLRLDETTKELFPDGYSYERLKALPDERSRLLFAVAHMAALTSVLRYPRLIPGHPSKPN